MRGLVGSWVSLLVWGRAWSNEARLCHARLLPAGFAEKVAGPTHLGVLFSRGSSVCNIGGQSNFASEVVVCVIEA